MVMPVRSRPGLDIESWLVRKIKLRNLRELPPYHAHGGGVVHLVEAYARLLLKSLQAPTGDLRSAERIKDDARAFRSWVEGNQLDLISTDPRHTPRMTAPRD